MKSNYFVFFLVLPPIHDPFYKPINKTGRSFDDWRWWNHSIGCVFVVIRRRVVVSYHCIIVSWCRVEGIWFHLFPNTFRVHSLRCTMGHELFEDIPVRPWTRMYEPCICTVWIDRRNEKMGTKGGNERTKRMNESNKGREWTWMNQWNI